MPTINDVSGGDCFDRFVSGLKFFVWLKVLQSQNCDFAGTDRVAIQIDIVLCKSQDLKTTFDSAGSTNDHMELGNIEQREPLSEKQRR